MDFFKGDTKIILAPMAGVCDRAFREVCKSFGASYTVTEMASAKALTMNDKKTSELLTISDFERPTAIQIFGNNPETMAEGAKIAMKFFPDAIDINMGCPAPKVASNGCGSSLMKDPELSARIVDAVANSVNVPVTVKMRTGINNDSVNAPLLAKMLEEAGAQAVCVHGRTKEQMYALPIDFETIKAVKESVSIPVIGNGDIKNGITAKEMLEKTGCDAIMVGRGALGRPWVFQQIKAYLEDGTVLPEPGMKERMNILKNHIERLCLYKGDRIGMQEARKHAAWYIKGVRGAAQFRNEIGKLKALDDLYRLCDKVSAISETQNDETHEFDSFCFNNFHQE